MHSTFFQMNQPVACGVAEGPDPRYGRAPYVRQITHTEHPHGSIHDAKPDRELRFLGPFNFPRLETIVSAGIVVRGKDVGIITIMVSQLCG
jgi:hypothetical protein